MVSRVWYYIWYVIIRPLFFIAHPVFRVSGRENIPQGACLLCSNHSGMGDAFWMIFALRQKTMFRSMAKIELMRTPVVGPFLRSMGVFGVDRGHHDMGAVNQSIQILKSGQKLLINPEGTRLKHGERIRPKTGAVRIAVQAGAPILPVYISPRKAPFTKVTVVIGRPIVMPQLDQWTNEDYHRQSDSLMETIYQMGKTV